MHATLYLLFWTLAAGITALLGEGCAHQAEMMPEQLRQAQIQTLDAPSVDAVLKAFRLVLQEDGYQITSLDTATGRMTAGVRRVDNASQMWGASSYQQTYRTAVGYEAEILVKILAPSRVESQLKISKTDHFSLGGQQATDVEEEALYRGIYERVKSELRAGAAIRP